MIAVNQDKFNYTEWRRTGLPDMGIEQIAAAANQLSGQFGNPHAPLKKNGDDRNSSVE